MRRTILRVLTAIQLTRLTMAFGAVSDVWFVVLYTRAHPERYALLRELHAMPLAVALLAGAVVAIGLFAYGASLNDVLDVRHDTAFSPDRPIPAGRIKLGQAIVVTVGALIFATLASAALGIGAMQVTLLTAAVILFYNAAGKFIPAVGIVTIGLVHAAHMLIPNYRLEFTLPVWLVMTHAMVIAGAVHVMEDKRPRLTRRAMIAAAAGWAMWSGVILGLGAVRGGLGPAGAEPIDALWPLAAVIGFLCVAWWKTSTVSGSAAAEKLKRYGAMWQCLYGAAWLMTAGLETQALWIALFALAGFAGMTLIKEIMGLTGQPIAYRA